MKNALSTRWGVIAVGAVIGVLAPLLQYWGNPTNMGICVACFERDIAGAVGLHRAAVVQYMRPEIIGFVVGAFLSALAVKEFRPRMGSATVARFFLGMFAMIGALIFLGCPWRAMLRLSGGDGNAIFGLIGLVCGIWVGTRFFKAGYNPGRSQPAHWAAGLLMPLLMVGFFILMLIYPQIPGEPKDGVLFYSVKGPGAGHAAVIISLIVGLAVGVIAQRSRFCTMGAFRDLILFKQTHLFGGVVALVIVAFVVNLILGQFHAGFPVAGNKVISLPVADWFFSFAGMVLAGLAFALAGGCPGRQLFLAGEGDGDAGVFVWGMIVGAGFAHNFALASSPKGPGGHAIAALVVGLAFCLFLGFTMRAKS